MLRLSSPVSPALPNGPLEYNRQYQDQLNNVHRLFYNRLTQSYNGLITPIVNGAPPGGSNLFFPYAAVQRNVDKTFTANTATLITFDTTDFSSSITNDTTDGLHVEQEGVYNYQFSIQLANTDTQIHTAWVWLRVNGADVLGTGSKFDVVAKHGSSDGYIIVSANFYVQLAAGDHVELWAAVSHAGVYMEAYPVQTTPFPMPSIPSVVATLSFVSNIL